MQSKSKILMFFGIYGAIVVMAFIIGVFYNRQAKTKSVQTETFSPLKKNSASKDSITQNRPKGNKLDRSTKKSESKTFKTVTMDGYDPDTRTIIDPINLWQNYETRTFAGKVNHGEKVTLIKREGDAVLIETKSGMQGWVTYWFIKEQK